MFLRNFVKPSYILIYLRKMNFNGHWCPCYAPDWIITFTALFRCAYMSKNAVWKVSIYWQHPACWMLIQAESSQRASEANVLQQEFLKI